jgi:dienelactone hydrolase
VQNLIAQPLGTEDGTTVAPAGVRVFFASGPTVTGGTGTVVLRPEDTDGSATFTASGQKYYHYVEKLEQNQTSAERTWTFAYTGTPEFQFTVYVWAPVQHPDGWVAVTPATASLAIGGTQQFSAAVFDRVGRTVDGAALTWASSSESVATVSSTGLATAHAAGSTTLSAEALSGGVTRSGSALLTAGLPPAGALANHPLTIVNSQGQTLNARLYVPAGPGPFRAVVALHGCGGLIINGSTGGPTLRSQFTGWGERLAADNVVVLFVDSFSPRGFDNVCGDGTLINEAVDRVHDAYAGLAYVRALPVVDAARVAVLGWSNGGSAALSAVAAVNNPATLPAAGGFSTAISFYPGCGLRNQYGNPSTGTWLPYAPTRILHGGEDDLQPNCVLRTARAVELVADAGATTSVLMTTYAGARHSFDNAPGAPPEGGWLEADYVAQAAARAVAMSIILAM